MHLPCSWTLQAKALWLYETTALLPKYLPKQWGRYAALRQINYVLRLMRLPPTFLPPLRVPGILRRRVGDLRKSMMQAIQALQPPAAREWVLRNIRCVYLGRRKWVQQINLKQHLRRVTAEDFTSWTPQRLMQAATTLPGMKASVDNWRLPQWPTMARVGAALRESWQQWCWGARLRPAIRFRGADILKRCLVFDIPACPRAWAAAEERLESFGADLGDRRALVRDDKDGSKMWVVDGQMGYLKILQDIIDDPNWILRPDLTPEQLDHLAAARHRVGLPSFL